MNQVEDKIREYVINGGDLFTIIMLDSLRDGGTGIMQTTKETFYIDKDDHTFHSEYPTTKDNLITDELLTIYLTHLIERYIEKTEQKVIHYKNVFNKIINKRNDELFEH